MVLLLRAAQASEVKVGCHACWAKLDPADLDLHAVDD